MALELHRFTNELCYVLSRKVSVSFSNVSVTIYFCQRPEYE